MELQSTFVMAVIIGALLLADRLGGSDEYGRRMYQVALAVALGLTVISGTAAFILEHGDADSLFAGDEDGDNTGVNRLLMSSAAQIGLAVAMLIYGISMLRRWTTVAPAFVTGGVLLLFVGGTVADVTPLLFFAAAGAEADRSVAILHFAVVAIVTALVLLYGLDRYEGVGFARAPLDDGEGAPVERPPED